MSQAYLHSARVWDHADGRYYSKLPSSPAVDLVYVLDPLIATGGTAVAALGMLTEWGLSQDQLRVVSVLGSTTGVEHVNREFPGVKVGLKLMR